MLQDFGIIASHSMNPWDYLNGTEIEFGINAGKLGKTITGIYYFFQRFGVYLGLLLLLIAVVVMVYAQSGQQFSKKKEEFIRILVAVLVIASATGILGLGMTILNAFFGVS